MKWILENATIYITGFTTTKRPATCLATEFYCDNKCIPGAWKCDHFDDCNDKTDEQFCGKIISSHKNLY